MYLPGHDYMDINISGERIIYPWRVRRSGASAEFPFRVPQKTQFAMQDQALDAEVEDGEEDISFFTDIDELQAHGINAADLKKLKAAGICTVRGVQMTTRRKMCNIKGLSEAKVDKIKEVRRRDLLKYMNALD